MASLTLNDHPVTGSWVDITVATPAAANVDVMIRNLTSGKVQVVKGGASSPTNKTGVVLAPGEDTYCNADHIWVQGNPGSVSLETL